MSILAGILVFFSGQGVHQLERRAARDVRAHLEGEGAKVIVRAVPDGPVNAVAGILQCAEIQASLFSAQDLPFYVEPDRKRDGSIRMLVIDLHNFRLRNLSVESLHAEIPNCKFDVFQMLNHGRIRLSRSGEGTARVDLSADAIAAYLKSRYHEITSCSVRLCADKLWVEGTLDLGVIRSTFRVRSGLTLAGTQVFRLAQPTLWLDGVRVDPKSSAAVMRFFDPVVDLDRDLHLQGAMDVSGFSCGYGHLLAWGKARIPVRP